MIDICVKIALSGAICFAVLIPLAALVDTLEAEWAQLLVLVLFGVCVLAFGGGLTAAALLWVWSL